MNRLVLTIPFNNQGPEELEKLLGMIQAGVEINFEGCPYWVVKDDGTRLLCMPVAVPEMPEGEGV